ncbi:MAG TPA: iron-containing alcohol dehydrogenase [Solirubrobacterales bacterium]|nr:iron-containing alcohol dehydrogenase [Solirubrobacterales bacterium]
MERSTTPGDFAWRDGERIVVFRRGGLGEADAILREHGWDEYDLLSTARALKQAPRALEAVGSVHEVPAGGVPEAAKQIMATVRGVAMVALGGGRVIDTAKAIAAVHGGRVCAIPTTLSGAEMTAVHRLPEGHEGRALVRPALVIADPDAMTSQPEPHLRASAMNALAHGAEALYTPFSNPVATMAALRGAELIATALDAEPEARDRAALALGSILCAYALDSALFSLHHVVCQTLVRVCGTPHAETNATMLPRTMEAMRERAPDAIDELAAAIGTDAERIGARIEQLGGGPRRLADLELDPGCLDDALEAILKRPELGWIADPPDRTQLEALIEAAR